MVLSKRGDFHLALHWFKKAGAQGHPPAFLQMANFYLEGKGCRQSIDLARECVMRAEKLHREFVLESNVSLNAISDAYLKRGLTDEALEVAQHMLDTACELRCDVPALNGNCLSLLASILETIGEEYMAARVAICGFQSGYRMSTLLPANVALHFFSGDMIALGKFWLEFSCMTKAYIVGPPPLMSLEFFDAIKANGRNAIRELRACCGGCGASLEDDERRKICEGCRTHCYCSRDCQKRHWNRRDGKDHRRECKEVKKYMVELNVVWGVGKKVGR